MKRAQKKFERDPEEKFFLRAKPYGYPKAKNHEQSSWFNYVTVALILRWSSTILKYLFHYCISYFTVLCQLNLHYYDNLTWIINTWTTLSGQRVIHWFFIVVLFIVVLFIVVLCSYSWCSSLFYNVGFSLCTCILKDGWLSSAWLNLKDSYVGLYHVKLCTHMVYMYYVRNLSTWVKVFERNLSKSVEKWRRSNAKC